MILRELLSSLHLYKLIRGSLDTRIAGIETDSRKIKPGYLFVALKGFTVDGHQYISQAMANGASAVLVETEDALSETCIQVPDTKKALAILADRFYNYPTHRLKLIGVTGTNGKTTITHIVEKILQDAGFKAGIIGTIQMRFGEEIQEVKNTTPESLELQRLLAYMANKGATHACIEVSSHALELGRVWGCNFRTAIFTNLTQDHLDYHQTMEKYRDAKALLFSQLGNTYDHMDQRFAILNADDPASEHFQKVTSAQVIRYGIHTEADVRASDISISSSGTSFMIRSYKGDSPVHMKLVGLFSVYNALAAAAACLAEGIDLRSVISSLETIEGVRGRFERVHVGQDYSVIVDYAHTPDSLENVLKTAEEFTQGKLYCIVGCGGNRDKTKRPLMAAIAVEHSDHAIFTSDNPRFEDPQVILDDMVAGVPDDKDNFTVISNRKEAIEFAVSKAQKGDCILIAGKGHETYQIVKDQVFTFDDKEVASVAIKNRIK